MADFSQQPNNIDDLWIKQFPLRTNGRHIVNRYGENFKFVGVNWYGASDSIHVVAGLTTRSMVEICENIALMGFTVIRLPFSNEMLRLEKVPEHAIDYELNPLLINKSPLEVYDEVVNLLGENGVTVVLNNHTTVGMWSGGVEPNGLWFLEGSEEYTEDKWICDWIQIAQRYITKPWVVGYDLRNEVRPVNLLRKSKWPLWGRLGVNQEVDQSNSVDWRRASGRCAEVLISRGMPGLIIVERLAWPQESLSTMLCPSAPWEPNLSSEQTITNPISSSSNTIDLLRSESDIQSAKAAEAEINTPSTFASNLSKVSYFSYSTSNIASSNSTSSSSTISSFSFSLAVDNNSLLSGPPSGWHKVPQDRVVLALHQYAWSGPGNWSPKHFTGGVVKSLLSARDWMSGMKLYGEMGDREFEQVMDEEFGWVLKQNICPVWLSEFGCDLNNNFEMTWFRKMCKYLEKNNVDFAYWPLNVGIKPVHSLDAPSSEEAYGLLTNDWSPRWHDERLRLLRSLLPDSLNIVKPCGSPQLPVVVPVSTPLALFPYPACQPLPGPLVDWDQTTMGTSTTTARLPLPKYDWKVYRNISATNYAHRVELAQTCCITGGFGGFTLEANGRIIYQNTTCEELNLRALGGEFLNADVYIGFEIRRCQNRLNSSEDLIVAIGMEKHACSDAYRDDSNELNIKIRQYISSNPQFSTTNHMNLKLKKQHISNASTLRNVNFGVCKHLCLEGGFGGFAVDGRDGTAYFRSSPDSKVLRRALRRSAKHTSFYLLTVTEWTLEGK